MGAKPLHFSPIPPESLTDADKRLGLLGAKLLGFSPMVVQTEIWDLLEAKTPLGLPLYDNTAIEVPRRAGKTEGIFSEAIGRSFSLPDYQITYCAQSGTKSRERFYGVLRRLQRSLKSGVKSRESRGEERFEFLNGSILRFLPPQASSFRGDAQDWIIFDEAQEVDEDDAADLIGSVMPVFDTRESGQLTVAGTAGASRRGLLWDALEKGRNGTYGILEYAAGKDIDPDNPEHWLRVHPGPAGVSQERALTVLLKRHEEMSAEMFAREYLGIWPMSASQHAFDLDLWERLGREMEAELPNRIGLAYDVTPSGSRSAVMAVWRDEAGFCWIEVIKEASGSNWVADYVAKLAIKYKTPIGYDTAGVDTLAVADDIVRKYPKVVKLRGLTTIEFATSCATFSKEVLEDRLRHTRQPALTSAIANASRRPIRDAGWAWGRKQSSESIAPLVAGTVALRMFDDLPATRTTRILTARTA